MPTPNPPRIPRGVRAELRALVPEIRALCEPTARDLGVSLDTAVLLYAAVHLRCAIEDADVTVCELLSTVREVATPEREAWQQGDAPLEADDTGDGEVDPHDDAAVDAILARIRDADGPTPGPEE